MTPPFQYVVLSLHYTESKLVTGIYGLYNTKNNNTEDNNGNIVVLETVNRFPFQ